jgi:DNA-binding phage protein
METLLQELEANKTLLARGALDAMYAHPFWLERFGERGRRFADQDSEYHLSYLAQALRASDPAVLTHYARWLQSLLVSRGMCTLHIAENFQQLGQGLQRALADRAAPALALLEAARDALRYDAGPARELQECAEQLVRAARGQLGPEPELPSLPQRPHDELAYFVSYLADALAQRRPELLQQHVLWSQTFLVRHGQARGWLARALSVLREQLSSASPALRAAAVEYLTQALAALQAARDDESAS